MGLTTPAPGAARPGGHHCHYPQSGVIASFGRQLLDWLNGYTFPSRSRLLPTRAWPEAAAEYFVERLLAHGTTTASVFATVHRNR